MLLPYEKNIIGIILYYLSLFLKISIMPAYLFDSGGWGSKWKNIKYDDIIV